MTHDEWLAIEQAEKANQRYYDSLAKWYEPYDRFGQPLRKKLPASLEEFRKQRRKQRRNRRAKQ